MVLTENMNGRGNKGLKIEEYEVHTEYSITINPQNQPLHRKHLFKWFREWHDWFAQYKDIMKLIIYPEVSATGRWHWHGTIQIEDITEFVWFLRDLNKCTHFEIDTIAKCECPPKSKAHKDDCKGRKVWYSYMLKQFDIWEDFFDKLPFYYPMEINKETKYIAEPIAVIKLDDEPKGLTRFGYEE